MASWSSDREDLYSDGQVAEMAESALADGKESGRIGTQFYRKICSNEHFSHACSCNFRKLSFDYPLVLFFDDSISPAAKPGYHLINCSYAGNLIIEP